MLTVTKLRDVDYLINQVAVGLDDYYLGRGEAPGVWHGKWAAQLGLEGIVDHDALRALLDGRDPVTGADLLAGRPAREVAAFDATFSAPKSASLLWAFGTSEVAAAVSIAHVESVAAALDVLEAKAGVARQQTAGVRRRVATSGLAVATFVHRTSREGDPQLHTHCVIPNLVARLRPRPSCRAGSRWPEPVAGPSPSTLPTRDGRKSCAVLDARLGRVAASRQTQVPPRRTIRRGDLRTFLAEAAGPSAGSERSPRRAHVRSVRRSLRPRPGGRGQAAAAV